MGKVTEINRSAIDILEEEVRKEVEEENKKQAKKKMKDKMEQIKKAEKVLFNLRNEWAALRAEVASELE